LSTVVVATLDKTPFAREDASRNAPTSQSPSAPIGHTIDI
jgi:hypothetical protein